LASYDYDIIYKPGKSFAHADFLSRSLLPVNHPPEEIVPAGVHLLEAKDLETLSSRDIAAATQRDRILRQVLRWTQQGWPESVDDAFRPYWTKRNDMTVVPNCLLWNNVVFPQELQSQVLALIHVTHLGENYSKATARAIEWWPNVDSDVADTVKVCQTCQQALNSPPKRVVTPWPRAQSPWERVHLDYAGPIKGKYFLLGVDSFSSWPIVKLVTNLTAETLITHVRYMFSEYGKHHVIFTDNGRQFVSGAFEDFLRENGVRHLKTPPWHPASNGVIERTVQTFKRLLSKFQCGDVHAPLARVLYSMRTSPSSRNGKTPAESLGRPFRTHLTQLHPEFDLSLEAAQHVSALRPGECAWILKYTTNSAKWIPGVIIKKLRFESV